ncbi:MAG: alcohol dehydrogenase catalytic domain-containing protein [Lachnospiraceae bacterium]|nr:alcohol dehydrogenase catalytic domain-containing protein [Lachnospiraceae bacterium]
MKAAVLTHYDKRGKAVVHYKTPLVMGNEFSGVVEKAGRNAYRFKKEDRVYGRMPLKNIGAFAEYAAGLGLHLIPELTDLLSAMDNEQQQI